MQERFNIALAQIPATEDFSHNLEQGAQLVMKAASEGARLVAFTEVAFRRFFPQFPGEKKFFEWGESARDGKTVTFFKQVAHDCDIDIAINFFENAGGGRFYDTTMICRPDGSLLGPVRMVHAAEEAGYHEKYYYWPGDTPPQVFDLGYARLGVAICYDRHFPEYTRPLVLDGAQIILSPFAGALSDPIDLYKIEMQALAFQNQVYVACVNRTGEEEVLHFAGNSFAVGPDGHVIASAGEGMELLTVEIDPGRIEAMRLQRPFLRDRRPEFYAGWPEPGQNSSSGNMK